MSQSDAPDTEARGFGTSLALAGLSTAPTLLLVPFSTTIATWGGRQANEPGMLFNLTLAGSCVGTLVGGAWVARTDPLAVLRIALPSAALATALVGLSPGWRFLALTLPGMASLLAIVYLAVTALISRQHPRGTRRRLSVQLMVLSGMGVLLPLAAGWIAARCTPPAALHAWALMTGVIAAGLASLVPSLRRCRLQPLRPPVRAGSSPRWRNLGWAGILAALHVGADTALFCWAPILLAGFGPAPIPPAWVLSGYALSYLIGRSLLAALPERLWGRGLLVAPGLVAAAVLLPVLIRPPGFFPGFLLLVLASFFYGLEYPSLLGHLATRDQASFPLTLSATAMGGALGGWLSTAVVGAAAPRFGLATALLVAPACLASFSLLAWNMTRAARASSTLPATLAT